MDEDLKIGKGAFFQKPSLFSRIRIWWRTRRTIKSGMAACPICGGPIPPDKTDCETPCWSNAWNEEVVFLKSYNSWVDALNAEHPGLDLPIVDESLLAEEEDEK